MKGRRRQYKDSKRRGEEVVPGDRGDKGDKGDKEDKEDREDREHRGHKKSGCLTLPRGKSSH